MLCIIVANKSHPDMLLEHNFLLDLIECTFPRVSETKPYSGGEKPDR